MSDRDQLLSFGFEAAKVDRAIKATKASGLQAALDWLESHQDDTAVDEAEPDEAQEVEASASVEAKSLKCLECGKIFKNTALASYHGEKSGHADFEESTEEIAPLTEEEKKDKLAALRAKMDVKRQVKAKEDAEAAKKEEALRRKGGKDIGQLREEIRVREAEKAAAQRKQEVQADKEARQRIKAQIEADKKARADKAAAEKAKREGRPAPVEAAGPSAAASAASTLPKASSSRYAECRLQLRLPTGSPVVSTFNSDQPLSDVVDWLVQQPDGAGLARNSVRLSTTFPRKQYAAAEMSKSLADLGLAPASALVVSSG